MTPARELSMSAIRKNGIDTITGKMTRVAALLRFSLRPSSRLPAIAINSIRRQAAAGMWNREASSVWISEFRTSFIPVTASAVMGVGVNAACQVFMSALRPTLLKASDLPVGK